MELSKSYFLFCFDIYIELKKDEKSWSCLFYCEKSPFTSKEISCQSISITVEMYLILMKYLISFKSPKELKIENESKVLVRCGNKNSQEYLFANKFCSENSRKCNSPNPENIVVLSDG